MRCGAVKPGSARPKPDKSHSQSGLLSEEHGQVVIRVTAVGSLRGRFWVPLQLESYMANSFKSIVACGCLGAVILATAACSPRRIPAMTVTDLMEDRVTLDGVLMKCNQNQAKARTDSDCLNARIAIERLASQSEPNEEAKRAEEFERNREKLRTAQDKLRQVQEAQTKVDAYHLPLVPVEPAPASAPAPAPAPSGSDANPPIISQVRP